jgi:hypothetical protein
MIQNNNQLTSLPFYTDTKYQDHRQWWVDEIYRLTSPNDRFLPFQINKSITSVGGGTCTIPSDVTYTADFSVGIDGWTAEMLVGEGTLTLSNDTNRLKVVYSGVTGGVISIKKRITTTQYSYNASSVTGSIDGLGTADLTLIGWNAVLCDEGPLTHDLKASTYNVNSSGCTGDTKNDYFEFAVQLVGTSGTIFVNDAYVTATPYELYNNETPYQSNFTADVDGWAIQGSTSATLTHSAPNAIVTYNAATFARIKRDITYTDDNISTFTISLTANGGGLGDYPFKINGKRSDGSSITRYFDIFEAGTLALDGSVLTYKYDNIDNFVEFTSIEIDTQADGDATTTISDISLTTEVLCVESAANIWTTAELIDLKTGTPTDISTYMNANTVLHTFSTYQIASYDASVAFAPVIEPKHYYLHLNDGVDDFYSEVFSPCSDTSEFIKIEWWRDEDLVTNDGTQRIVYSGGFINTLYLIGDIGKPEYEYEIEQTTRNGMKFIEKVVSFTRFSPKNVLINRPLSNVLAKLPHHEYITITAEGITYNVTHHDMETPTWEEKGDIAEFELVFETNTVMTSANDVAQSVNQLLADEETAINIRGNNRRIFQLNDTLSLNDLFLAADKSSLSEAVRIPISVLTQAVNQENLPLSTSIYYGGEITVNSGDNTKVDIAALKAIFVDNYTDPSLPVATLVTLEAQLGVSVTDIATQEITFFSLDSSGNITQSGTASTPSQDREFLELGAAVHVDNVSISKASSFAIWNKDLLLKIHDLGAALGNVKVSGNKITPTVGTLNINRSAGTVLALDANRQVDPKNPNYLNSSVANNFTFVAAWMGGETVTNLVPVDQYDKDGAGTLVSLPTDRVTVHGVFYSTQFDTHVLQYGQYDYDNLKKAVDSWDKEGYIVRPEVENISLVGVIAVKSGATDLSDPLQAKFITPGAFGIKNNVEIDSFSRFADSSEIGDGMTYERADVTIVEDTGVLYAEVEKTGGGDMTYIFNQREYTLDCTTGSGTAGKARIALTAGTATVLQENWLYVISNNDVAILQQSTSRPTGQYSMVADFALKDVASYATQGAFKFRRWTDALEFDGRSTTARTNERIRTLPAEWESGIVQALTIDAVPSPDSVTFTTGAGEVWQKHLQAFPALDIATDGIYIVNHPTTPYLRVTDLNSVEALQQSDGTSLSGARFNWVIWGVQNKDAGDCKLFLNLPVGQYGSDLTTISDPNNYSVTSIPKEFKGVGFLIARLPMRHRTVSGGTYENLADSLLGRSVIDLRGIFANVATGAVAVPASNEFDDALFRLYNTTSGFGYKFSGLNLTGERIYTMPDESGKITISQSVTTSLLSAGNQIISLPNAYPNAVYDYLVNAYDISGYPVPVQRISQTSTTITVNIQQSAYITIITNRQ